MLQWGRVLVCVLWRKAYLATPFQGKGNIVRTIGKREVEDMAVGAAVLASGGGGDPYIGKLMALQAIDEYGPFQMMSLDELPDDAFVCASHMLGAPTVLVEKVPNGMEGVGAVDALEKRLGRKFDAIMPLEAGGLNSLLPFQVAAAKGVPIVDCDGMGRAFPGIQQDTFTLNGVSTNPFIIADEKGNCTVLTTINNDWTEEIGREITTACGGQVTTLASPMNGEKMKTSVVVGTVDYAQKLGRIIRTATDADNPEQFFLGESGAFRFFKGKITDVLRETRDGFNFGRVTLEGIGEDKGKKAVVEFQNENIYAEVDGEIVATVPDLICLVDSETFVPITTENLKYGKRALVVGLPCDAAWRTPRGLELAGPAWFGLKDVEYRPVEERYAEFSKEESHA